MAKNKWSPTRMPLKLFLCVHVLPRKGDENRTRFYHIIRRFHVFYLFARYSDSWGRYFSAFAQISAYKVILSSVVASGNVFFFTSSFLATLRFSFVMFDVEILDN